MTERRRPVDRPRRAALDVLTAVRVDRAYANLVLPQVLRKHGLEGRDAALATELASGAIRMQGLYDPVIDACLTKPKLQAEVRDVLRLGAHQLLSMRVPDHAAISTSVDLVRAERRPGSVRAGQRRAPQDQHALGLADWVAEVAPDRSSDLHGHLAVARSHPRWVVDALAEALASTASDDELDALLEADNAPPRVTLVARPGLADGGRAGGRRWHPHQPVAVRRRAGRRRPGGHPGRGRGPRGRAGRGLAARRPRDGRRRARRARRAVARPLRRSGRQGGPPGRPRRAARRPTRRQRAAAAPSHAGRVGLAGGARRRGARAGRRRHPTAVGARHLRPGARRRAVLGPRRPAATRRVALAAYARGRRRAGRPAAGAARRGHRLRPSGRDRGLRDLLAGARRDDRRRRGRAGPARRRRRGRPLPAVAAPRRHRRDVRRDPAPPRPLG